MERIKLLALSLAHEGMGFYPEAVHGGENPYEKRTEWMEGWNAYGSALSDAWGAITNWIENLPSAVKRTVEELLWQEKLHLSISDGAVNAWVLCNDLFFWGCADGEDLGLNDLPDFLKALQQSPEHGDLLWVARKRGMRPQAPYYKYFTTEEISLFDDAGPVRDDPDGKRKPVHE